LHFLLRWGVLDTTLCDKVCQWLARGQWCSPGTPVSSTNKTDRHYITEILLKVALNTITLTLTLVIYFIYYCMKEHQYFVFMMAKTHWFWFILLAHLAKGNVSFCHHLASVNFSHFNLFLWNPSAKWTNLVGSIYGRSSIDCSFRPDPLTNMATTGNSCFWLAYFF
jgi:hypothetical protein